MNSLHHNLVLNVILIANTEEGQSFWPLDEEYDLISKTYGVFFSTKKCTLYLKKWNFVFVS